MFYSVAVGRKVGIFLNWDDCAKYVKDYGCAIFRNCTELSEATFHLNTFGIKHNSIVVYTTAVGQNLDDYCQDCNIHVPAETCYQHVREFDIGRGLFIDVGSDFVDINRKDWNTKERENGIFLFFGDWTRFLALAINQLFADLDRVKNNELVKTSYHLVDDVYVTVESPYPVINIRHWSEKDGVLMPTKNGIAIRGHEVYNFIHMREQISYSYYY